MKPKGLKLLSGAPQVAEVLLGELRRVDALGVDDRVRMRGTAGECGRNE